MSSKIEVEVVSIYLDKTNQSPVLLLREKNGSRILPIWIGYFEAQSILLALKGVMIERPLTHDLCSDTICILGGKLVEVDIHCIVAGIFHSRMVIDQGGSFLNIDSRPSDSVSIALRQSCPIYVDKNVMDTASVSDMENISKKDWEEILSSLPDEAFGKYNM